MKITIVDHFTAEATAWLKSHSEFDVAVTTDPERLKVTDALILRSQYKLPKEVLDTMPNLKYAVTATVGFDHIDLAECAVRGIKVAHSPVAHSAAACELTWALLLACARKIVAADKTARTQDWSRHALLGTEFAGKVHGIVGLGRIGTRVAKVARAFGMTIVAHDPYRDNAHFAEHEASRVGLDELFHLADSISLHVPLTKETKGRINKVEFAFLKPHSIVVNTSRGGVIKEDDLVLHLKAGGHGMFGLDVFTQEPLRKGYELQNFPQVTMTPHIGANTREAFSGVSMEAARNLVALIAGAPVSGPLPPPEDWYRAASGLAISHGV